MYSIDPKNYTAKFGKVAIRPDKNTGYLRVRFTYPKGIRNDFRVATQTPDGFLKAQNIAQKINRDIEMGCFDISLATYSEYYAQKLAKAQRSLNLKEIWENYKIYNIERVAETTKKYRWVDCDRLLEKSDFLELAQANSFIKEQLEHYSLSTLGMLYRCCLRPALNFAISQNKIESNPYTLPTPKQAEADVDCYEAPAVQAILDAIKNNTYCPISSAYKHSFYYHYVYFQVLTGSRPENTCALTWQDYFEKNGRYYIKFNKAYYRGVLMPFTKNKTIILFPVNPQLKNLLDSRPRNNELIFPSYRGKRFRPNEFNRRVWKRVIKGLMADGVVDRYLPPYSLRHSFITRLVREGIDVATIASLCGNSVEVIINRYLKARHTVDLPEF